jgi:hypothetical protein
LVRTWYESLYYFYFESGCGHGTRTAAVGPGPTGRARTVTASEAWRAARRELEESGQAAWSDRAGHGVNVAEPRAGTGSRLSCVRAAPADSVGRQRPSVKGARRIRVGRAGQRFRHGVRGRLGRFTQTDSDSPRETQASLGCTGSRVFKSRIVLK